jgi:7-cyano-7-deazaguanine synthase
VGRARRASPLVVLKMPLADLLDGHWSVTGQGTPDIGSREEAVYLPGHNVLLLLKASLWCHLRGIDRIALASLKTNPFSDATPEFFAAFQETIRRATGSKLSIVRPFEQWTKADVMQRGRDFPLELTFSCLAPIGSLHCGRCNKCAERQTAFRGLRTIDPTRYAFAPQEPQIITR